MVKVVYIGNYLQNPHTNPPYMVALGRMLEQSGVELRYASSKTNKLLRLLDMTMMVWKSRKWAQWVLIDTYSTQNFYYAYVIGLLCHSLGLKYANILHGGNLPDRLEKSPKKSKKLFGRAQLLISPSGYMMAKFEQAGFSNLKHIPNGIDLSEYEFREREFDKIKLLWVRSLKDIYNPLLALKVLKRLDEMGKNAELCMIGPDSGGLLPELQEYAGKYKLEVEFTGKLSKSEWHKRASGFNFLINTTHFDNMPLTIIEGMALGLAVISTDVGGMPYLIEHDKTGKLVPPNSEEKFVDAILQCVENPVTTRALTRNARHNAERFDLAEIGKRWLEVLTLRTE